MESRIRAAVGQVFHRVRAAPLDSSAPPTTDRILTESGDVLITESGDPLETE